MSYHLFWQKLNIVDIPSNVTTLFRSKLTTHSYSRFCIKKVTFISVDFC